MKKGHNFHIQTTPYLECTKEITVLHGVGEANGVHWVPCTRQQSFIYSWFKKFFNSNTTLTFMLLWSSSSTFKLSANVWFFSWRTSFTISSFSMVNKHAYCVPFILQGQQKKKFLWQHQHPQPHDQQNLHGSQ